MKFETFAKTFDTEFGQVLIIKTVEDGLPCLGVSVYHDEYGSITSNFKYKEDKFDALDQAFKDADAELAEKVASEIAELLQG